MAETLTKEAINVADYSIIAEGKSVVLAPKEDKVFYNPIQQFNRDLLVMGIRAWTEMYQATKEGAREGRKRSSDGQQQPFLRILEALSATGLRAIRYGHEIPHVARVVANDMLPEAVKSIDRNIVYNELQDRVVSNHGDAIKYMLALGSSERFHVVDLDPYGSATPFIDGALQAIRDEGLLVVTCTDAGVLAGLGYPEKCFALYGGNNFGNSFMGSDANHEVGLRLILHMIATNAAKYKKSIEPLLCLSIDFYFRLFIRVKTSPAEVKKLASNTMITYHCSGCGSKMNQPLGRIDKEKNGKFQLPRLIPIPHELHCEYCEGVFGIAGPMWLGNLHNHDFVGRVLKINESASADVYKTRERVKGMVTLAKNELTDTPFYFNLNQLLSFMKSPPIPINDFARAVGNLGYDLSLTHAKKNCVKTTAPWEVVLQIMRQWLVNSNHGLLAEFKTKLEKDPENAKLPEKIAKLEANMDGNPNLTEGMVGFKILKNLKKTDIAIDFDTNNDVSERTSKLRNLKMVRYQENPTKNWGPKARPSS